jgi:hypothetical protein
MIHHHSRVPVRVSADGDRCPSAARQPLAWLVGRLGADRSPVMLTPTSSCFIGTVRPARQVLPRGAAVRSRSGLLSVHSRSGPLSERPASWPLWGRGGRQGVVDKHSAVSGGLQRAALGVVGHGDFPALQQRLTGAVGDRDRPGRDIGRRALQHLFEGRPRQRGPWPTFIAACSTATLREVTSSVSANHQEPLCYRGSPVPVTGTDGALQLIDPPGRCA